MFSRLSHRVFTPEPARTLPPILSHVLAFTPVPATTIAAGRGEKVADAEIRVFPFVLLSHPHSSTSGLQFEGLDNHAKGGKRFSAHQA